MTRNPSAPGGSSFKVAGVSSRHFSLEHERGGRLVGFALFALFQSLLAGGCITELAFGLWNCTADRSKGHEATVTEIKKDWRTIYFRTDAPFATFKCPQGEWTTAQSGGLRFFVYPGRLGAMWGEFR